MTKKIEQHIIPRVYLKHFQIDEAENKSFVYSIDFSNPYNQKPQRKGLNDSVFKAKKYYNDHRLADPFSIEDVLGSGFEPMYEEIIKEIRKEQPLSRKTVEDLMIWLYISKLRSPFLRKNNEQFMRWYRDIKNGLGKRTLTAEEMIQSEDYIRTKAKEIHLNSFSDLDQANEMMKTHFNVINAKYWRVLKSLPGLPFCTNDNPGFSPNLHPVFAKDKPFHHVMELNSSSIIYYVLTPEYCLEISPFFEGTPLTVCAMNMEPKFEPAELELIEFINQGVFYSKIKLLISNSKTALDKYLKYNDSDDNS